MLPLALLSVNRLHKVTPGSFARSTTGNDAFFVGQSGGKSFFVRREPHGYFYSELSEGTLDVAAVSNLQFLVDWDTAMPVDYRDRKNGALCLKDGVISVCSSPWNGRDWALIELGKVIAKEHGQADVSFSKWTAYVRHEELDYEVWLETGIFSA